MEVENAFVTKHPLTISVEDTAKVLVDRRGLGNHRFDFVDYSAPLPLIFAHLQSGGRYHFKLLPLLVEIEKLRFLLGELALQGFELVKCVCATQNTKLLLSLPI